MSQDQNVEVLWSELTSIGSIDDRRVVVYNDKNKKSNFVGELMHDVHPSCPGIPADG